MYEYRQIIHHNYNIQSKNIVGLTLLDFNNVVGIITIDVLGSRKRSLNNTVFEIPYINYCLSSEK